ncbi:MAG: hypothetical protein IAE67_08595 [Candidatus Competibacteraceae bacterium]|nr:hypothetical protein [Candidatus Competibacteraceae bacterium]
MKKVLLSVAALFAGAMLMSSCKAAGCRTCTMSSISAEVTLCPDGSVETCVLGTCQTDNSGSAMTTEEINAWADGMESAGYNCN